jgi:hypothetical protein
MTLRIALFFGAALLAALPSPPALAQSNPFQVRESEIPPTRSPTRQQEIAAEAAAPLAPALPQTTVNAVTGRTPAGAVSEPRPFDVNGDGLVPVVIIPEEEREVFRPSTTISPLANGQTPPPVVPVDAINEEQRGELSAVLREDAGAVRELRVNVENDQTWADSVVDRPIVPFRTLRLDGEIAYRSWSVFLSAAEAARGGTLSIAFTNSVLVLPEASRLRVFLNGRQIAQTAIDSPDRTKVIALPVSSDLLRPGENAIRIEAEMRHRIDCSINATYELWTRIDTRLTGFSFSGARIALANLTDLPAVGVGPSGATRLRVIQRAPGLSGNMDRMLRAVQSAALRGRFVQPLVEVVGEEVGLQPGPGILNIAIGVYDDVRGLSPEVPVAAATEPLTALIDTAALGPTVIISGPNERAVDLALARFDAPAEPGAAQPAIAATPAWLVPGSVRINGPRTVTLREAGVETLNFSGRRFSTEFNITLPPDFYAAAYGEARLLLDAAYSGDVRPGSRLSIYVNGVLSTSVSLTSSSGQVLDDFPIVLVMQNFRPGINTVQIVADLNTEADRACLPGGTVPARDRFALFSSTRLVFPQFARIGQIPSLASFATNGFPYQLTSTPVRVSVGGESFDTIGAAGTLMARVAVSRGASFATNVVEEVAPFTSDGVIIVAPLGEVPNQVLEETGTAPVIPATWLSPRPSGSGAEPEGLERYDDVLRRLRQQLRQEEVRLDRSAAETAAPTASGGDLADPRNEAIRTRDQWLQEVNGDSALGRFFSGITSSVRQAVNFNVELDADDGELVAPLVAPQASIIMAQSAAPTSTTTAWTLVTAPTPALLSTSLAALSSPEVWTRLGGRLSAYDIESNTVQVIPAEDVDYVQTVPLTFGNLRLIAANWFSINNGVYAIALVLVAAMLGLVTWLLVTRVGRQS